MAGERGASVRRGHGPRSGTRGIDAGERGCPRGARGQHVESRLALHGPHAVHQPRVGIGPSSRTRHSRDDGRQGPAGAAAALPPLVPGQALRRLPDGQRIGWPPARWGRPGGGAAPAAATESSRPSAVESAPAGSGASCRRIPHRQMIAAGASHSLTGCRLPLSVGRLLELRAAGPTNRPEKARSRPRGRKRVSRRSQPVARAPNRSRR